MHQIKIETGAFVNHVRIKTFRPKQTDPRNQRLTLIEQTGQFGLKLPDLMLNPGTSDKTELAIEGVESKIGQDRQGRDGDDKAAQKRLLALTGGCRHGWTLTRIHGWS